MDPGHPASTSSESEKGNPPATQEESETAKLAFDAARLRLQSELGQASDSEMAHGCTPDPRAPLVALLRAAAEQIVLVYLPTDPSRLAHHNHRKIMVEADRAWYNLSGAVSGQTWGAADTEAKQSISSLKRKFRVKPFSKVEAKLEMSCRCLVGALKEEPRQPVLWHEADHGAPSLEGEFKADSKTFTILVDAATNRLRIIKWDLETMRDELTKAETSEEVGDDQLESRDAIISN